jgi:undecaprenyl-diphosphatase
MSRSGSTISGALFQKFDRVAAARFSFLLSIPSVAGAGLYEGYKTLKEAKLPQEAGESAAAFASRQIHWAPTIVATIVAFIVGYISIAFFLKFLGKHGIAPFVWYRVALGLLIFALVGGNLIKADVGANTSLQAKPDVVQQQP